MTLSPTALEEAAKHFDPDAFAKDQHGYLMIRGESRRKRAKQAATAAIAAYLAQAEKEGWVMVRKAIGPEKLSTPPPTAKFVRARSSAKRDNS